MYVVITEKSYWTLSLKITLLEQQSHGRFNLCFKHFVVTDADEFRINNCNIFFSFRLSENVLFLIFHILGILFF